ncbi:MAG: hypothetical protein AAGF10_06860, partial [Verrucomicrobiota bacterium]
MKKSTTTVILFSILALFTQQASAALNIKFNNILVDTEFVAGTGANSAMIIVAYPDTLGDAFAFYYQWDGSAFLADAFNAIQADSSGNFVWDGNNFVLQMDYFDPDSSTQYDSSSTGWMSFWGTTEADATDWSTNPVGNADYVLSDGEWQWVNADVENIWPGPGPNVYSTVAVPEPATFGLI